MMIRVAIIEREYFGIKAWLARCLECGWESKVYESEGAAVRKAKKHIICKPNKEGAK